MQGPGKASPLHSVGGPCPERSEDVVTNPPSPTKQEDHCESSGLLLGGEIDGEAADARTGQSLPAPLCRRSLPRAKRGCGHESIIPHRVQHNFIDDIQGFVLFFHNKCGII